MATVKVGHGAMPIAKGILEADPFGGGLGQLRAILARTTVDGA